MFFNSKTPKEKLKEKRMKEKPLFETWAISQFPLISKLFSFDEESMHYQDRTVDQLWTGWLGAKGLV